MKKDQELKKPSVLREMDVTALRHEAEELREHLMKLRFQKATGALENPQIIRFYRRALARVETLVGEKMSQEVSS